MQPLHKFAILIATLLLAIFGQTQPESPPNIVIILADDYGVGNIQAHYPDNKLPSPHLDRFSAQSMRFTNAHSSSAVCTPPRYGLLTGRYAWRTRLQEWVLACYEPPLIPKDRLTLPGFLKQHGYATACIGKWHLGWNWPGAQKSSMEEESNVLSKLVWDFSQPILDGPTTRGFDTYFGTHVPNFPPFTFIENDRILIPPTDRFKHDPNDGKFLPRIFDGNPMAPDWRFESILPEITKRAVAYIHEQSKRDQPFFLYFPMTSPHTPIVPNEAFKGRSGISAVGDFLIETDWSAGQVIGALDEAGVADNSIVIFTSDNGHLPQGWNDLVEAGHIPSGPYRGRKTDIWEGGHRVPFLIRWPEKIAEGSVSDNLLSLNDVFATIADILSESLPPHVAEDSFSFKKILFGESVQPHRDHIVAHSVGGEFAYIEGGWKVVFLNQDANRNNSRGKPRLKELYHLSTDIAESKNLIESEPERAMELTNALRSVIARGTSREGPNQTNDAEVIIDVTQQLRWTPTRLE